MIVPRVIEDQIEVSIAGSERCRYALQVDMFIDAAQDSQRAFRSRLLNLLNDCAQHELQAYLNSAFAFLFRPVRPDEIGRNRQGAEGAYQISMTCKQAA
jgi:hypothetical protein